MTNASFLKMIQTRTASVAIGANTLRIWVHPTLCLIHANSLRG